MAMRHLFTRGLTALAVLGLLISAALGLTACGDDDGAPMNDAPPADSDNDFAEYVGLSVEEAQTKAEQDGRPSRVVRVDGEDLAVTMDFIENRLNFEVENGRVTAVTTG